MSRSPSGAQLELARRVGVPGLDEELLRTPPVGRGRPDPVGEQVTAVEVLRVAVGFLAARLEAAALAVAAQTPRHGILARLRRRHRPYVVQGRSLTAEVVRRSLAVAGGVEGGRRPLVLVVGDDLPGLVQGRWTRLVRGGSGQRWRRAWSLLEGRDRADAVLGLLPEPVPSARETHLLLLPPTDAVRTAGQLVGLAGLSEPGAVAPLPAHYDPARVDLLRRVHQALATRLMRAERARVAAVLDTWLPSHLAHPVPRLAAPPEHAVWAVETGHRVAGRLAEELAGSGVTVHGEPALVVPSSTVSASRTVPAAEALDRALAAIRASAEGRA